MQTAATGIRRLVLAAADARVFSDLRAPLIEEALRRRHKVLCMAPEFRPETLAFLDRFGAGHAAVPFETRGFNPFAAYGLKRDLVGHLSAYAPHTLAVCDGDILPILTLAAAKAGVPRIVPMLSRLPLIAGTTAQDKALRSALLKAATIIVDTPEDRRALVGSNWFPAQIPVVMAPTAGIWPDRDLIQPLPSLAGGFIFALVSRADDKLAVDTFQTAAAVVKARSHTAVFTTLDPTQTTATAADLLAHIAAAHVVVHASPHAGLNPGLLAGLAAGRPVITTDVAGSRDTVDERVNGCRIPPGDSPALAAAMISFLKRADLIPAMARASRLKAERRYDVREVNRLTLDALGLSDGFAAAA
jgi:glycosyltransferase involved in cell wall biosynthesis